MTFQLPKLDDRPVFTVDGVKCVFVFSSLYCLLSAVCMRDATIDIKRIETYFQIYMQCDVNDVLVINRSI